MTPIKFTAALGAFMMAASPALATTIANQDKKEHTLTVDHGATQDDRKIAAGESVKIDCPERCGFRLRSVGYGQQPANDENLIINTDGMLQAADDAAAGKGAAAKKTQ